MSTVPVSEALYTSVLLSLPARRRCGEKNLIIAVRKISLRVTAKSPLAAVRTGCASV